LKILVLSSQASNTGSTLRAEYAYKYLKKTGNDADYIGPPFKSMPFMLDFILSMFYYFFKVMNRKYEAVFIVKPYPNTVLPVLLLKSRGAKIIIDIDDMDYGYRKGALSGLIKNLQHRLTKAADYLTSHNDALIKLIKKEHPSYRNRIYKLNQCVDMEVFSGKTVNKNEVKRIKKRCGNKKILFYMANMNIASYLDDIIDACSYINNEDAVLVITGGGPLLGHYRRKAAKKLKQGSFIFTGHLNQKETVNYLASADLCLVYYKNVKVNKFRASMKLREYLAFNRPVIATKVGEIVDFKRAVYLCPASAGAFAGEISKRLNRLDKRYKKGYKIIREKYDWHREMKKFNRVLKGEIING